MIEYVKDYLKMNDVEYKEDVSMSQISSVRIGGRAKIIALPDTEDKMAFVLRFLKENKIKHKLVGRMTNVLPCDFEYLGVILKTDNLRSLRIGDGFISVSCGEYFPSLASRLAAKGIGGLERLSGIPGSVGGLITNNAGAYGAEIGDMILSGRVFNIAERRFEIWEHRDFNFGYRSSALKSGRAVLLHALLRVEYEPSDLIRSKIKEYKSIRANKQPLDLPSLGSVFKSRSGYYASRLIDECSLKGTTVGAAQVSPKHAGFIVNLGGATARDYKKLVDIVADTVREKKNITLEREIEYLE